MKKVLVFPTTFGIYSDIPCNVLNAANIECVISDRYPENEADLINRLQGYDGTIVGLEHMSRQVMQACPQLKVIAKYGVGLDKIDCDAAQEFNISVLNTPGANADSVADLAFGMMIALARSITAGDRDMKSGLWKRYKGYPVGGATIGIIGLGAIGKCLACRANGFGMNILACDIFWDDDFAQEHHVQKADLEEIYRESDFISIHVGLSEDTMNMISDEQFKLMKPSAFLINCARGGIVNENALYDALKNHTIAGAALDAFCQEPIPPDSPLLSLDNIIVAPHMGASAVSAINNMAIMSAQNVASVLDYT